MVIRRSLNLVNTEQKSSFKQTKERAQAKKHKQISQLKRNFGPTKKINNSKQQYACRIIACILLIFLMLCVFIDQSFWMAQ